MTMEQEIKALKTELANFQLSHLEEHAKLNERIKETKRNMVKSFDTRLHNIYTQQSEATEVAVQDVDKLLSRIKKLEKQFKKLAEQSATQSPWYKFW